MEFGLSYDAGPITVLAGLEAVRKRPGMYIGSTGPRGLHHLVYEVVDNAVDEALAGYCDTIEVTLLADGGVRVHDNGRGIPVDEHPIEHRPAVELVMTTLHAGGKFDSKSYAVSGGLHGVGVSVVNALSVLLEVEVHRDGYVWTQAYDRGAPMGPLERGTETADLGTIITFWPDGDIFETTEWNFETLSSRPSRSSRGRPRASSATPRPSRSCRRPATTTCGTGSTGTRARPRTSSTRPARRPGPGSRRARRATSPAASRCSTPPRCRASWPTASPPTRPSPRSTWSRATRPAARPRAAGTRSSRPSCRSAARSSTWRSRGSTACSRTTRSSR